MNVCVLGLYHLGTVTAACLAAGGHQVVGLDFDPDVVAALNHGRPPIAEPGLPELVQSGLASGRLRFTADAADATKGADVLWVTYDTPVDDDDRADVDFVIERASRLLPHLATTALVLISSQVPVGSTRRLEAAYARMAGEHAVGFGYVAENLRLGRAIDVFSHPDRVVVGLRRLSDRPTVTALLQPFTDRVEWMSVESAEMTKHAINAFLALSIAFINEIATLCEQVGADALEVERGLKSEGRIGPRAYLAPGSAFAGGTLARDVVFLSKLADDNRLPLLLLPAVKRSNETHRLWVQHRLNRLLGVLAGKTVAIWGLTYKPGTNTLRRSSSVELGEWLVGRGARVRAHDPGLTSHPLDLAPSIDLVTDALAAVDGASALVVATPWPEYLEVAADQVASLMNRPLVLDANRFLARTLGAQARIEYVSVGNGMRAPRPLEGRCALITGASQGLGLAIARAYVEAGASLLICARDAVQLDRARAELVALAGPGQVVLAQSADVSRPDEVRAVAEVALQAFPRLHILVNNAGVYGPMGAIESTDWTAWEQAMAINLFGSVLMCRALVPHFRAHGYGKIVQLSGGGATNPLPRISAYAASKAAVVRFAETLAEEVRGNGVDVNAIAPGALNTRMLEQVLASGPDRVGAAFYDRALAQKQQGGASPERAAALAIFLGSAASDGISGKLLSAVWDPWETLPDHFDDLRQTDVYTLRRIMPHDRGFEWGER